MFNTIFSDFLHKNNLSGYKVAKETGISQSLISDYKNGKRTPTAENLIILAKYFDCSTDYLLGLSQNLIDEPEDEHRLMKAYRQLTDEGRQAVLMFAEVSAENPKYQKYTNFSKEA